jgi:hypothetical protein
MRKFSFFPLALLMLFSCAVVAQTIQGPTNVKQLNGTLYADQFVSSKSSNNGISNAMQACASLSYGCIINVPPLYSTTETQYWNMGWPGWYTMPSNTVAGPKSSQPVGGYFDQRYGVPQWFFNGSIALDTRHQSSPSIVMNNIKGLAGIFAHYSSSLFLGGTAYAGGRNSYADKTNFNILTLMSTKYTQAQNGGDFAQNILCFGNGDCVASALGAFSYGGPQTGADEGLEAHREEVGEGGQVFSATIDTITPSSDKTETITTTAQTYNGYQGEGRLLIDLTHKYNAGYISSFVANGGNEIVSCTGCAWDSTFGTSAQTTLTAGVKNEGAANTFPKSSVVLSVASSAGFTVGNLACVFDYDYECEKVTAVGTGTVTIATDRLPHTVGAYVTTGGLAGYAIELEADRVAPGNTNGVSNLNGVSALPDSPPVSLIRNAIPIMYNVSGNQLALFQSGNTMPGHGAGYSGRAYSAMGSGGSIALTISGGVVTSCTASGGTGYNQSNNPPAVTVTGSYTKAPVIYAFNSHGAGALNHCAVEDPGVGVAAAIASVVPTNPYDIYPAAKVTNVYNTATGVVDGTFTTEPPAGKFAPRDAIEEPHYFWQHVRRDNNAYGTYIPSLGASASAGGGGTLKGIWQGNDRAFSYVNGSDPTLYADYPGAIPWVIGRGQLSTPYGIELAGPFRSGLFMDTPPYGAWFDSAVYVGCGTLGCAKWTSPYYLLMAAGNGANDGLSYNPSTRAWYWTGNSLTMTLSGYKFGITNSGQTVFPSGQTIPATSTVATQYAGTTGNIGGSALAAGMAATGTATVTNTGRVSAPTSAVCVASPILGCTPDSTYSFDVKCRISAAGTATVSVVAIVASTPTACTYGVRVLQ